MTVGEKIQYYRKRQGLSQEELGQKLMVSRQTISLWENDQTLPTIDNLIRLKEIFGASIDDILCQQPQLQEDAPQPREKYAFTFSPEDMAGIARAALRPNNKRALLIAAISAVLAVFAAIQGDSWFISGCFAAVAILFALGTHGNIKQYKQAWGKNTKRVVGAEYIYSVYDAYFSLEVYDGGVLRSTQRVPFSAVDQVHVVGDILQLEAFNQLFLLRKSALVEGSPLIALLSDPAVQPTKKPKRDKWQNWSIALFVATLLTIYGALIGVAGLSAANNKHVENMWVFFLFLPIPVGSVVLGFVLKAKGYKWKKNVIAGAIIGVLLVLYGSFTFIFSHIYDHSDAYIDTIEGYTQMDIPQHSYISTQDWSDVTQSGFRGQIYYVSDIYFDEAVAAQFEAQLQQDPRRTREVKNEIVGLLSGWDTFGDGDYVSVYNIDERLYNTVPSESGTYRFLSLFYDPETAVLQVVEYDLAYVN